MKQREQPYSVYKITNSANGKLYIGITKRSLKERFDSHAGINIKYARSLKLRRAIEDYGVDSFSIELVDQVGTLEEARNKEIQLISELDTYHTNGRGYNMTRGGGGYSPPKNRDVFDTVQTKTTRRARSLLRIIAAITGGKMQTEAERIFEAELKRVSGRSEKDSAGGDAS